MVYVKSNILSGQLHFFFTPLAIGFSLKAITVILLIIGL